MASTQGIKAGAAYVELYATDNHLVRGLESAQKRLKAFGEGVTSFGKHLVAAGVAASAPMLASVKIFTSMGDSLAKASDRTGIAVETLSELSFAADMSGSDMESLETGIRRMQKTVVEAADGTKSAVDALADLGLTVEDLQGLTPDQMFKLIADRLAAIPGPSERAAAAMAIFGKGGAELLPLMKDGAKGIEALQEQARSLGLTLSTGAARDAERFGDTMDVLWKVLKRAAFAVGAALAPSLTDLAHIVTDVLVRTIKWIDRNRQFIVDLAKLTAVAVATGIALVGLGYAIQTLGVVCGGIATVITTVGAVIGTLGSILGALLTPIGLVITGIVALGAYILYATGLAGKALDWLGGIFRDLKDRALTAYQGIADALAAGDIALAAKVLWLALKVEWQRGINYLEGLWLGFKDYFLGIAVDAFYGAVKVLAGAWHGLRAIWVETTAYLYKVWTQFTSGLQSSFRGAQLGVEEGLHHIAGLLDKTYDVEQAIEIARVNEQADQQNIEQGKTQALQENDQQREQDLGKIGSEFEADQKAIDQAAQKAHDDRRNSYQKQIDESMAALEDARKQYRSALDEAAKKRRDSENRLPPPEKGPGVPEVDDLTDRLSGLGDTLEGISKRTVEARGTFNAAAIQSLQTDRESERIANATEETARNTRRLVRDLLASPSFS